MAGLAQGLQIGLLVGAAVLERDDVVNLGSWSDASGLLAVSTHRVSNNKSVADFAPRVVVTLVDLRVTSAPVVLGFCLFEKSVLLAVSGVGLVQRGRGSREPYTGGRVSSARPLPSHNKPAGTAKPQPPVVGC